ncbi:hypothetical protein [Desertimonas flava]|uniref:hypothetical protein n=1 Tax=Desertimonas flava TaxID=2064846 RepID=UPI000E34A442|nr:hypothetical protein [Desertimonas flava]
MRPPRRPLVGLVAVAVTATLAAPVGVLAGSDPPSDPPSSSDPADASGSDPAASDPTGAADSSDGAGDADLAAARAGLATWLQANRPASPSTSTDLPGCPAIELETFEAAMADAGVSAELGGWGTEIEWSEYAGIDPDLMGIVCAGDTDGDANDSDAELAAGLFAVDAGTDERAVRIVTGFSLGALDVIDADIPGISGGTLTTGCLLDGGLSACLTFWDLDGLIVGTSLMSDVRELPDGSSQAVLEAVLPQVLATLTTHGGAVPTPPPSEPAIASDGTSVGDARAGLIRVLSGADTPLDAPLEPCVLADVAAVDAALETSGADTPLSDWGQWIGPLTPLDEWPQRGIVCTGSYVGAAGDASFPELNLALAVADFGDDATLGTYFSDHLGISPDEEPIAAPAAGGETIGRCVQRDRVYDCYEAWTDGSGFVVAVHIEDQTFFDRQSASVVVDELVPSVLDALGSGATQVGDELAGIDGSQVDDAEAALLSFVESAGATSGLDCPVATADEVAGALDLVGIDHDVDDWRAHIQELETTNGTELGTGLVCTDGSLLTVEGVSFRLEAISFLDVVEAEEMVAAASLTAGGTPEDVAPGTIAGSCTSVSGQEYCNAWWRDGTFVVGVTLLADADADEITRNDAGEVLTTLVPTVLSSLATIAG